MNLVERVKNILVSPKTEWPVVEAEKTDVATLYTSYILILAAISPVCSLVGGLIFGMPNPLGGTIRLGFGTLLAQSISAYVVSLIVVYVVGMIVNFLAPTFGGTKDPIQGLKVAAYASTPGWLAGILNLVPSLAIVALLAALYGLYLLYLGLPVCMKSPKERAVGYTVVVVVSVIVVTVILGVILGMVFGAGMMMKAA